MAVTLQQIAEACGVSRGTVDRALRGREGVRPEVAEGIKKKAREMGYIPRHGNVLTDIRPLRIGVDFAIGQDAETQAWLPLRLLYQYLTKRKSPTQRQYTTEIGIKFRCNLTD